MVRLGLISDTHIPSRTSKIPSIIKNEFSSVDMIIHAGDFESIRVANELEELAPLIAVHGNMCYQDVKEKFPARQLLEIEKVLIGITHGSGGSEGYADRVINSFSNEDRIPDIIICGHTHQPMIKKVDKTLLINPGSPTDKYFAKKNTFAILTIYDKEYNYYFIEL